MKRIAIIGLGSISVTHIAAIRNGEFGHIEAICDIRPERVEKARASIPYPVRTYSDYRELLAEVPVDVVHICTPHFLHKPMAIAAMQRGADVYLEKPAALTYDEGLEILAVQRETGRKVCVSFQNRLLATHQEARRILQSGEMGAFRGARGLMMWKRGGGYYTDSGWRGSWETEGGGVLMNQSIHTLDLLYYLGGPVARAEGTASLRKNGDIIEVEDTAEATLFYESGATAIFYATNCNVVDSPVQIELYLEKGSLLLQDDRLYRNVGHGCELLLDNNANVPVGKKVWGVGHATMIRHFYEAIDGADSYYCTLEDGLTVLKIIRDIYATNPRGRALK